MRGRAPAGWLALLLCLGGVAEAQPATAPAVNNGALDALKPAPRPERPAPRPPTPRPQAPKTAARPAAAPAPMPVPPKPPALPTVPPAIAAIPPADRKSVV